MEKVNEKQTNFDEGNYGGKLKDGTPVNPSAGSVVKAWVGNNLLGFFAALSKRAGKSDFNGNPETENSSEIADAIETIINNKVNPVKGDLTTLSTDVSSNYLNKNSTEQIVNSTVRCKNQVVLEARKFFTVIQNLKPQQKLL